MITLAHGGLELDLAPEVGGSITRLAFEGREVMRPTPRGCTDVLETCSFPLVPYANRIENGLLHFEGQTHRLQRNMGDHPHPLHGYGWRKTWRVESVSRDQAIIAYDHEPNDWPWAYSAEQVFALADDTMRVRLAIRSRATQNMPVGLGFHPYFPRMAGTRLTAAVKGMWKTNDSMIPTEHVEGSPLLDLAHGALVDKAPFVDNCFTGWRAPLRIEQPDAGVVLSLDASPECRFCHIYIPVGQTFFAAEPVSAMPNSFSRPEPANVTGMRVLAPGESFSIEMSLGVKRS